MPSLPTSPKRRFGPTRSTPEAVRVEADEGTSNTSDNEACIEATAPRSMKPEPVVENHWARWRVKPAGQGAPHDPWEQQTCPRCDTTSALLVEPLGSRFFCAHCSFQGDASVSPDRHVGKFPLIDVRWPNAETDLTINQLLTHEGVEASDTTGFRLGQAYFDDHGLPGWRDALIVPVFEELDGPVVDLLQIQLDDATGGLSDTNRRIKGARTLPWGWEHIHEDQVLIVERPVDRLALLLAGQAHVVCLPSTINPAHASGGDFSPLTLIEERIKSINRIELAFQDNEAGHRLEEEISRRLGRDRCLRTRWQSHALADDMVPAAHTIFQQYGSEGVVEALAALAPYPVAGIHELIDVDEEYEAYYEFGFTPGPRVGLPSFDLHYSAPEGQLTLVLGVPGHGKSTLVEDISIRLAKRYDWNIGVFSPENQPIARYFASLTEKYIGKPFSDPGLPQKRMTRDEKNEGKRWVQEHFRLVLPDDEHGNWSLDSVLERARTLVFRHGIKGFIIDPWNELEHTRPAHLTHDDYLAQQLAKLRRFARISGLHVWVVAHPTKLEHKADNRYPVPTPYNTAGGAMWFNKSDFILVPYRHRGDHDEEIVDIYVQKVRQREHGRVGVCHLRYDLYRNCYVDDVDFEKRMRSNNMPIAAYTQDQLIAREREDSPTLIPRAEVALL